jgi:hypothetical protein
MKKYLLLLLLTAIVSILNAQVTITGTISASQTWTKNNTYILKGGFVYVTNAAEITVEPGTIIKGDGTAIIFTRGTKLIAKGTETQPIIFTSFQDAGKRAAADWGGIVLLGKAPINVVGGEASIEGGPDKNIAKYGGTDPNDNSGILEYVRIEFAGIAFQPDNETNSLTLGGVGAGTTINHVQNSFGGDDAVEWFGGNVNGKYLVAYKTLDDMFDTDFGYTGKNQYLLGVSDPQVADVSGSNGFESDNDATGTVNTPITDATFMNATIVGPKVFNATINANFKRGAHIRRSSKQDVQNSIITGFPTAFRPESSNTINAYLANDQKMDGNIFDVTKIDSTNTDYQKIVTKFKANNTFAAPTTIFTNAVANNFLPLSGSEATKGANFTGADAFFEPTTFRGAFGTKNWATCWTEFDPINADYTKAINNTVLGDFTATVNGSTVTLVATSPNTGAQFAWDFGANGASTTTKYNTVGTKTIVLTVTSAKGCETKVSKTVNITTAVKDIDAIESVLVYPNPTAANLMVSIQASTAKNLTMNVQNIVGQSVMTNVVNLNSGANNIEVATESLQNGSYFLQLSDEIGTKTIKFVVNK